jgi:hypothetical protein
MSVDYDVLNQKGSPAWFSDIYANIPTAGYKGRMFISIDTYAFYRDTGSGWDLIGGPGTGTITGSGTSGQVSYFNGSSTLAGSNNLFWDNTNSRLGINTATPGQALDIHSTANTLVQLNNTTTGDSIIALQNQNVTKWKIGNVYNAGANSFDIYNVGTSANALSFAATTNNAVFTGFIGVGTGATTPPAVITSYSATDGTQFKAVGSAPAITFSNTLSSPPYNCAIGMATAFSNFITGANIGDFCITNQTTGTIIFGSGTTERARFSPTGLFLLGTSTPSSFLFDCNGQGRFQNILTLGSTLSNGTYFYTLPSATGTLALTSALSSYLPLAGGTLTGQLYINPTNTLTTGLDVASNNTSFRSDNLEGNKRQLLITMGSGTLIQFTAQGYGANYGTDLAFYTATTGGVNSSPAIYITGTNNRVGIKTGLPSYDLDVNGTLRTTNDVTLTGNRTLYFSNGGTAAGTIAFYNTSSSTIKSAIASYYNVANEGNLEFLVGGTTTKMVLNSSGQLFLNTTSQISSGFISIAVDINTYNGQVIKNTNSGNSGTYMLFANSANVTAGYIQQTGATTVLYVATSDYRYKENIKPIQNAIDRILKIKPVTYNWKNTNNEVGEGFIAHELQEIVPLAVSGKKDDINEDGTIKAQGIDYAKLTPLLVKAIQELNEKLVRNNIN